WRAGAMAGPADAPARDALARTGSRGGHARRDFPDAWREPCWQYHASWGPEADPVRAPDGFGPIPHGELPR
ncbi:MAG: hypothetical protein LDL22_03240, partial [Hyphomicrobiales bacterium]|nr:hypothetical protein [Hyphomicrobiales bacterium]